MSQQTKAFYEFGPFRLEPAEHLLRRENEVVPLTPKAFHLLLVLVERHGHLLEKEELLQLVWPDTVVEEANLASNISQLRKALGEGENGQRYIETLPKLGYRFVAEVREIRAESAKEPAQPESIVSSLAVSRSQDLLPQTTSDESPSGLLRRHWRKGLLLFAAAVFVAALAFYVTRPPKLTEQDTILIADFDNRTGDEIFDGTLKQALAVHLGQSPFLNIFSEERVREALKLMSRSPDERLTREVTREICQRQGLKAMLLGSIAKLDRNYAITLEAINGQNGETIARQQVEAEGKEQVIKMLGSAATKLRENLGESLASIQKFDVPLEQVTTPSLAALKAFSLGTEQYDRGQMLKAIPFYRQAVELDTNFALAYAKLGMSYVNSAQIHLAPEYAEKAFALRERVSEREKYFLTSRYYINTTWEYDKAVEVCELWTRNYPRDFYAHTSLGYSCMGTGQYENALAAAKAAIRLHPNYANNYQLQSIALIALNRFAEARGSYEQAFARNLEPTFARMNVYLIAFVQGDTATMQRQLDWMKGKPIEYQSVRAQALTAEFAGRMRQAREFYDRTATLVQQRSKELASGDVAMTAIVDSFSGKCQQAREDVTRSLALARGRRALNLGAIASVWCGDISRAQSLKDELGKQNPKDTYVQAVALPIIEAQIALARGNYAQAIQHLQPALQYESAGGITVPSLRGQAYLKLGQSAEAAAEFQKIIDHRGWDMTSLEWPLAHLGLARAAAMQGDTAKAQKFYQEFFTLWKDADADLPVLIEAKKEYEKLP